MEKNQKIVSFSPREIVSELDRFVIGQAEAKRAVAIALRNRWRRQELPEEIREEVLPKNILMIGPTGVGKTEISRRLSKLAEAPFIKVEATKFTEVGYVGKDVEQILRDLIEISIALVKDRKRKEVQAKAQLAAENRVLEVLVGKNASAATKESYRKRLRAGDLDDNEIEIMVSDNPQMPSFEIPGMQGNVGMVSIGDIFGKGMQKKKKKKMTVKESYAYLIQEESEKLMDDDQVLKEAKFAAENNGIVFLDEIDKVSARSDGRSGADVSREGVQRDLLPLIEGTTVNTKHGPIKTDHILFIASGAFQLAKPSDLLPELQGRLPIRVELNALTKADFIRILKEPDNSLIKQYTALLGTENVTLNFTDDAIDAIAEISTHINSTIENIGARRLHTILEKILDDISFNAPDKTGETLTIDKSYVDKNLGDIAQDKDLSKFIL
jgi:ATP-dependent HslUV protease ATP-binding subunit HslU